MNPDYSIEDQIDEALRGKKISKSSENRIRFANEIKAHPPKPGFMETKIEPAIYSIDLNNDAHWWFSHVCTVFPLLIDQGIRTHMDLKESFKPEKRFTDFKFLWVILIAGIVLITLFLLLGSGVLG